VAQKCTFCVHLLEDGWKEPRCVQACPTGCLKAVCAEEAELEKMKKAENLEVYLPALRPGRGFTTRTFTDTPGRSLPAVWRSRRRTNVRRGQGDPDAPDDKKTETTTTNNYGTSSSTTSRRTAASTPWRSNSKATRTRPRPWSSKPASTSEPSCCESADEGQNPQACLKKEAAR